MALANPSKEQSKKMIWMGAFIKSINIKGR
ncbi:MAG: hypothetical protein ACI91V_000619 [Lentimonas sp.]